MIHAKSPDDIPAIEPKCFEIAPKYHEIYLFIIFRYIQHQEAASAFFPLRHILLQCSLARIASPALQSTWQECHFFHKGSVMLTQRLLNLLLELINALLLQLLATCLSLYLSGRKVWCSNAASFQPALLDRESSNWLGHVGRCLYAKGRVQVLQAWQVWGSPFLQLTAPQLTLK